MKKKSNFTKIYITIAISLYIIYALFIAINYGSILFIKPFTDPQPFTDSSGMYPTSMDSNSPGAFIFSGIMLFVLPIIALVGLYYLIIIIIIKIRKKKK